MLSYFKLKTKKNNRESKLTTKLDLKKPTDQEKEEKNKEDSLSSQVSKSTSLSKIFPSKKFLYQFSSFT